MTPSLIDLPLEMPDGIPKNLYDVHTELCRLLMRPGETQRTYLFSVEYEFGDIVVVRSANLPAELRGAGITIKIPAIGSRRRFRLVASPMRSCNGKKRRLPIGDPQARIDWLKARGDRSGFILINGEVSWGTITIRRKGVEIQIERAVFSGVLEVSDPSAFAKAMAEGVGRGRALGFGLLQIFDLFAEDNSHV